MNIFVLMITVLIIGNGNVATHLYRAFSKINTISCIKIGSRNLEHIPEATISIIAVSDDAIAEISSKINTPLVVHTSGSVAITSLQNNTNKGVFYPLQTFSKERKVDFKEIPLCLEAVNITDLKLLETLANLIGSNIFHINSEQRKSLHIAAVFVSNFTNHLYKIGNDLCDTYKVPFEILKPLIKETAAKIESIPPIEAQTGPAIRNDEKTIKKHLLLLNTKQQEIYKSLTKSIQNGD